MTEIAITVSDAAKDLLGVLARVQTGQQSALLVQDGQPVARLIPVRAAAATCEELAERWSSQLRLPAEEARSFADDLEESRRLLPPLKPAWD
jgi:prevent-host-death family protein